MNKKEPHGIRVLAFPARRTRKTNAYAFRVQASTQPFDVTTHEFGIPNAFLLGWDIIHIHWPEVPLRVRWLPFRALACVLFLLLLRTHRALSGTKIIWTVHNLRPHERRDSALTEWYFGSFVKLVDGAISLSDFGRKKLLDEWEVLRHRPHTVVHHGHYRDDFEAFSSREEARRVLGLQNSDKILLSLGMIRDYKNLPVLAELVRESDNPNLKVIVAGPGKCEHDEAKLLSASRIDSRVMIDIGLVPSETVAIYFAACDLVVLPYKDILNSGSLLLALSLNRPVLTTSMGATPEIRELVGREWVRIYEGELNLTVVEKTLRSVKGATNSSPDLSEFEWQACGRKTADFFRELVAAK